jgi:renal tumor antigen
MHLVLALLCCTTVSNRLCACHVTPLTPPHHSYTGNNELDQIQKIHAITGTPPPELLAKLKKRSTHSSCFDFPPTEGSGLAKLLSHVPPDCADLIAKLLAYNPDERLSARQALRHPYFRYAG